MNLVQSLCRNLGGMLPKEEEIVDVLHTLNCYFEHHRQNFTKVHIYIQSDRIGEFCDDIAVRWERKNQISSDNPVICLNEINEFVCKIGRNVSLNLRGIPEELEAKVDTVYQLDIQEGFNQLRGVQKSYIIHEKEGWCLYSMAGKNHVSLFCYQSNSDYPPLGRNKWTDVTNNSTRTLLLSNCSENQFTCDSGDCIHLYYRCDTEANCVDKSDEDKCFMVVADHDQQRSIKNVPQQSLAIKGAISFTDIQEVNYANNNFVTSVWINITWKDQRQNFLNLGIKNETFLTDQMLENHIWVPDYVLKPVRNEICPILKLGSVRKLCAGHPEIYNAMEGKEITIIKFNVYGG